MNLLVNANAKRIPIADNSVNCVVTSPPYYGLRSYLNTDDPLKAKEVGLEQSPDDYVQAMVQVFREIHRVLRGDGVVWLNLGDSYAGNQTTTGGYSDKSTLQGYTGEHTKGREMNRSENPVKREMPEYLKPKDLIGIPWRVAFALQADGWWLRQDIIWHKPNPMPESVKDRCTKAHEYIFLLTKSARYWYDNEAIKEDSVDPEGSAARYEYDFGGPAKQAVGKYGQTRPEGKRDFTLTRNKRSVWTVTTKPYPGSHYAVFPPDLIEPCILAGCPETVCVECGAPYERVVERVSSGKRYATGKSENKNDAGLVTAFSGYDDGSSSPKFKTIGFQPTCDCDAGTKPGVVLDPFAGSGTTLMVARKHRRNAIGLDLNYEYLTKNARERLQYGSYVPIADGIDQLTIGGLI